MVCTRSNLGRSGILFFLDFQGLLPALGREFIDYSYYILTMEYFRTP